jgi:hypothetical protein
MFWFLFWVALSIGVLSFGFFMAVIIHRGNMKVLEILRAYAEKGIEPPPVVVEMLTRQMGDSDGAQAGREIGRKAGNFTGLLVAACVGGGIAWWRMGEGGPQWVVYIFAASALFFGVRAVVFLLTALTTALATHGGVQAMMASFQQAPQLAAQGVAEMNRAVELEPNSVRVRLTRAFNGLNLPGALRNNAAEAEDLDFIISVAEGSRQGDYLHIMRGDLYFELGKLDLAKSQYQMGAAGANCAMCHGK